MDEEPIREELIVAMKKGKLSKTESMIFSQFIHENHVKSRSKLWMTIYPAWKWVALIILGTVNSIGFWMWI